MTTDCYNRSSRGAVPQRSRGVIVMELEKLKDWIGQRETEVDHVTIPAVHQLSATLIVNEEYTPSAEEVEYARRVIRMDDEAAAAGRGSFQIDGKMIDIPVVVRTQNLLRRYEAIRRREAKTLTAAEKS
jgi:hypothetical protein